MITAIRIALLLGFRGAREAPKLNEIRPRGHLGVPLGVGAAVKLSWGCLGVVLGSSRVFFGPPLASLGVVVGRLRTFLEPSEGDLKHFKLVEVEEVRRPKTLTCIALFGAMGVQEGPRLGQIHP